MGRKAKASKTQTMKQPLEPNFPSGVQTIASDGTPTNMEFGHLLSDTSHSGKKKSKTSTTVVRRSRRLQPNAATQVLEPIVHEIHLSDSENNKELGNEKEDETRAHEVNKSPEQTSDETEGNFDEDYPGAADFKYKAMYINSQKKIEALMEENKELNKALEHAIGKIDVYEKQSNVYSEVMDVIASLSKANENLSAHVKRGGSIYQNGDTVRDSKKSKTRQGFD
ncbi:hypothetical protein RND81_01G076400 [Saponaria officinalis]|uniref:Uncharacterized protein n=1 Tax=Saponaria officinalis TaxID=3572 RepID=A0AAW1NH24_SAPOF